MSDSPIAPFNQEEDIPDDELTFVSQFLSNQQNLYSFIYAVSLNWDSADEIFQRVSLALWKKRKEYNPRYPFTGWAIGFAKTEIRKYVTEQQRQPLALSEDVIERLAGYFSSGNDLANEKLEALNDCLTRLPEKKRELITRCYSTRNNIQDVAESMSLSAMNVYQRLKRIRTQLHDCIHSKLSSKNMVAQ